MTDYLKTILNALPETPAMSYNGMTISEDHYKRLVVDFRKNSPVAAAETPATFGGIPVVFHPNIPDGFAVVTKDKVPVGIIDFAAGTYTAMRSDDAFRCR